MSPPHPSLPSCMGCRQSPPTPALPSAPGCFFLAHDLPDLLNKPPDSGKPAAFLVGKVVKGSNRCWKRQGGRTSLRHKAVICRNRKGCWGFVFFFPLRLQHKNKVEIGISACWGEQLRAPCPSGQSEPGQTETKQMCPVGHTRSIAAAVLPRFGVQAGAPTLRPPWREAKQPEPMVVGQLAQKNALVVINNFPASGGIRTPHPFWAVSLSLETVFLGTKRALSWFPLPLHTLSFKGQVQATGPPGY